jgi:hypothetical protein
VRVHAAAGVLVVPANLSVDMAENGIVRVNSANIGESNAKLAMLPQRPEPVQPSAHPYDSTAEVPVRPALSSTRVELRPCWLAASTSVTRNCASPMIADISSVKWTKGRSCRGVVRIWA